MEFLVKSWYSFEWGIQFLFSFFLVKTLIRFWSAHERGQNWILNLGVFDQSVGWCWIGVAVVVVTNLLWSRSYLRLLALISRTEPRLADAAWANHQARLQAAFPPLAAPSRLSSHHNRTDTANLNQFRWSDTISGQQSLILNPWNIQVFKQSRCKQMCHRQTCNIELEKL